jgi:hypothetical protein
VRNHDWEAVVVARSNVLIEGDGPAAERFVRDLLSNLKGPVVAFPESETIFNRESVVLVADVDRLDEADQRALMAAMERACGGLQIICTSTTSLYRRVERGEFLSALYYRLNTVWIALPPGGRAS